MKLSTIFAVALLAVNPALASCSSSKTQSGANMKRTVSITQTYTGVATSNGLTVNYSAGNASGPTVITIHGPSELVERVEPRVKNGVLQIRTRDGRGIGSAGDRPVVLVVGRPVGSYDVNSGSVLNLNSSLNIGGTLQVDVSSGAAFNLGKRLTAGNAEFDLSSGGLVNVNDLQCKSLEIDASSGALVNAMVQCQHFEVDASSGAVINLSGSAKSGEIDASSGAVISCEKMERTGSVTVDASSGAVVNAGSKARTTKSSGAIVK